VGETVSGIVRSVEPYGIFIELAPNLAGLAEHIPGISVGQQASVYIKSILRDKMKIKLIIIDSFNSNYSPEIKYYIPTDKISEWDYSPKNCYKRISTKFCG
jgi:small subunit ribosomal protein S1